MSNNMKNKWKHMLVMGCDSQEPGEYERSDALMIVSLNKSKGLIRITSLMRDLWVDIPGYRVAKINAATDKGGPGLAMETVNRLLDLNITRYVMLNFDGVVKVLDLAGGVDIDISEEERVFINHCSVDVLRILRSDQKIEPLETSGKVHLCGVQATAHMRNRHDGADYERTRRQRTVLIALFKKVKANMSFMNILRLLPAGLKSVRTNLSLPEIIGLWSMARNIDAGTITTFRIPAEGTYTEINGKVWRFETDFDANKRMFYEFIES